AHDDQDDPEDDLSLKQLDDTDDHEYDRDQPQDEAHSPAPLPDAFRKSCPCKAVYKRLTARCQARAADSCAVARRRNFRRVIVRSRTAASTCSGGRTALPTLRSASIPSFTAAFRSGVASYRPSRNDARPSS